MTLIGIEINTLENIIKNSLRELLNEYFSNVVQNDSSKTDRILTIEEAADFLKVSKSSIYKKVEAGLIPHCRPNKSKRLFFSEKDLIEFVKSGQQSTIAKIKESAMDEVVIPKRFLA